MWVNDLPFTVKEIVFWQA